MLHKFQAIAHRLRVHLHFEQHGNIAKKMKERKAQTAKPLVAFFPLNFFGGAPLGSFCAERRAAVRARVA